MSKLKFGLWDGFEAQEISKWPTPGDVYRSRIREVELAEVLGYEYYHVIEHQNTTIGHVTAPCVYLAAVAQQTSKIRLGTMVNLLPYHNPIRLAQDAALLDQLSEGRLEFGTGRGSSEHEFSRWGLPYQHRTEMAYEALEIIIKAWTEDSVTYEGRHWQLDEALPVPKPYQKPHPPVWVGCHSPETIEYAAKNNYNAAQNLDVDSVIADKFDYYRKVWRESNHQGPMPKTFLMRAVHVAETDAIAREEAREALAYPHFLQTQAVAATRKGYNRRNDTETFQELGRVFREMTASLDFWLDHGLAIVGSPDTVVRKLEEQQKHIGYDIFSANHRIGPMPNEVAYKSVKMFGEYVIPAFA